MKRFIKLFTAIISVVIFAVSCTEQDLIMVFGTGSNPKISATISGTYKEYNRRFFSSDSGTYQRNDHPQITTHEDNTFSFKLERTIYNKEGEYLNLCFDMNKIEGELEINKVYPLYLLDESRAHIDVVERNGDNFVTTTYNAYDGWIVFTKKKVHSGGFLFSGEFCFSGAAENGDIATVESGVFSNCRICWGDDYGCAAY